jgi:sulfopyruvate decarboxylase alpha subunit
MINPTEIIDSLHEMGFSFASGVPCSYFSRLIMALEHHNVIRYIPATREDEAVGLASGIALGNALAFVVMQNSGLATIGDALTSLAQLYRLPVLLFVSWRGLEADRDFPEHSLMGEVMEDVLKAYHLPFWELQEENWREILTMAVRRMKETSRPVVLTVKRGVL